MFYLWRSSPPNNRSARPSRGYQAKLFCLLRASSQLPTFKTSFLMKRRLWTELRGSAVGGEGPPTHLGSLAAPVGASRQGPPDTCAITLLPSDLAHLPVRIPAITGCGMYWDGMRGGGGIGSTCWGFLLSQFCRLAQMNGQRFRGDSFNGSFCTGVVQENLFGSVPVLGTDDGCLRVCTNCVFCHSCFNCARWLDQTRQITQAEAAKKTNLREARGRKKMKKVGK